MNDTRMPTFDELLAETDPTRSIDPDTGEIVEHSWTNLPDEFWTTRPELTKIRQAAHSRLLSADAVLITVLARVIMLTPPGITLPAIVASRASLNLFAAVIDASGGGKSGAVDVAAELLPHIRTDVADPILPSSGEGLIDAFIGTVDVEGDDGKKRKERQQTKTAGLAWVDEGQSLLAQGERSGSTIMQTIQSAWMGGALGEHNATEDRRRLLKAHRYRLSIVVSFQLRYAASLIADGEGGTPQRFTFASASDPNIEADATWPGELEWRPPPTAEAAAVVAAAYADPTTTCCECGRTLDRCGPRGDGRNANGTPCAWDAGHPDGRWPTNELRAECSHCNRSRGAAAGNRRRQPRHSRRWLR